MVQAAARAGLPGHRPPQANYGIPRPNSNDIAMTITTISPRFDISSCGKSSHPFQVTCDGIDAIHVLDIGSCNNAAGLQDHNVSPAADYRNNVGMVSVAT